MAKLLFPPTWLVNKFSSSAHSSFDSLNGGRNRMFLFPILFRRHPPHRFAKPEYKAEKMIKIDSCVQQSIDRVRQVFVRLANRMTPLPACVTVVLIQITVCSKCLCVFRQEYKCSPDSTLQYAPPLEEDFKFMSQYILSHNLSKMENLRSFRDEELE